MSLISTLLQRMNLKDDFNTFGNGPNEKVDLDIFLDIINDLQKMLDTQDDTSEEFNKYRIPIQRFINLITSPSKSALTGSSILGKRLNISNLANDIDIFIDNRNDSAIKIIQSFFHSNLIRDIVWPLYESKILAVEDKERFVSNANLLQTNSQTYAFTSDHHKLDTFQIQLGDLIRLNLILLDNISNQGNTEEKLFTTPNNLYPFTGNVINNFLAEERSYELGDINLLSTYVLEYIEASFDFQELKYVYDFKLKEVKSIYSIAVGISTVLLDKIIEIETDYLITRTIKMTNECISKLLQYSTDVLTFYSDPNNLTISSEFNQKYFNVQHSIYLDNEILMRPDGSMAKEMQHFSSLSQRIKKYQYRGFNIKDPGNVLINLHTNLAATVLATLIDPEIDIIERQAIFNSSSEDKKKYRFLNKLKTIVIDRKEELGMDLIVPPSAEEIYGETPKETNPEGEPTF